MNNSIFAFGTLDEDVNLDQESLRGLLARTLLARLYMFSMLGPCFCKRGAYFYFESILLYMGGCAPTHPSPLSILKRNPLLGRSLL